MSGSRDGGTPAEATSETAPRGRMDGVPDEFRPWLTVDGGIGEGTDEAPAHELRGLEALRRALSAPGRNRESAFHLLAADAHLTWAAEAFLEGGDPEDDLRALLRRVIAEAG